MVGPEKINIHQEKVFESKESQTREKWTKQVSDLLKKFWFASLVVALPSLAEAKEPVKFEDVWKTLTSGRVDTSIGSTITERSLEPIQNMAYLRAYHSYNAKLDSLLRLVPIKDVGEYLLSFDVDFGTVTSHQKDFRFLPVHELNTNLLAQIVDWKPEARKKGVIQFNTALFSPTDTTKTQFISVHEIGHFIRRRGFSSRLPSVIEEGLANWGAWKFTRDLLGKQGLDDKEIRTRLKSTAENIYSGETLLAALIDYLYKNQNILKDYYTGAIDFMSYKGIAGASRKLDRIIYKDVGFEQFTSFEILVVLRHLTSKHGVDPVKKAYKELKTKYFLDITEKNLGILKWGKNIVYFDKTTERSPFETRGEMWISTPHNKIVTFHYDNHGTRLYQDILSQLIEGLRTENESIVNIYVHTSMSLKEKDGSLRKEIKEILDPNSPEMTAKR